MRVVVVVIRKISQLVRVRVRVRITDERSSESSSMLPVISDRVHPGTTKLAVLSTQRRDDLPEVEGAQVVESRGGEDSLWREWGRCRGK